MDTVKLELVLELKTIDAVRKFANLAGKFEEDIDLHSVDRHYTVDGKSIMGIFSLDLRKDVLVSFIGTEERKDLFTEELVKAGILK